MLAKSECKQADIQMEQCYEDTEEAERDGVAIDTANLFFDYEQYDYCEKWLNKCHDKSTVSYRSLQARLAWFKGNHDEFQQLINKFIDEDPFCCDYWNNLASSQFLNNEFTKSIESCEYSLAIEPDNSQALLLKANCLSALTNFEEAAHYYELYAEQTPYQNLASYSWAAACQTSANTKKPWLITARLSTSALLHRPTSSRSTRNMLMRSHV